MQIERSTLRVPYAVSTVNVITAVFMGLFHLGAIAAFWYVSWANVLTALVLHWMAVGFGISLGYHRLHTHRGFKTSKAFAKEATAAGLDGLKGHRSVGGLRASIYNAFPDSGVDALVAFMREFERRNG